MQSLYLSPYAVKMLQNEAIIALTVTYECKIPTTLTPLAFL